MAQQDYSELIRAAKREVPALPQWLTANAKVRSPQHGLGTVVAILGERLIVNFASQVEFENWENAIAEGAVSPDATRALDEQIARIPNQPFREIAQELQSYLTAIEIQSPQFGSVCPIPQDLPQPIAVALQQIGIKAVYAHQIDALKQLRAGLDLCVATPTASGKTLCYNLAILESCLLHPNTSALYIFPLKALAVDQMSKLTSLVDGMKNQVKISLMTGDTPKSERESLFIPAHPHILGVSPDLLHHYLYHTGNSRQGEGWRAFLRNLRWIVIDESHTYIGAFGAHFANLMRRLRLAVDAVGGDSSKLQFICTTATIGNPQEMTLRFSGREKEPGKLHLISQSTAPTAGKTLLFMRPSHSANMDAVKIVATWLEQDLSGIVFCNSRSAVKGLLSLIHKQGMQANKVAIFYGSLPPKRRLEIVEKLQSGEIKVIISTSSLEAGIDLPELDCCLIRGFPGSLMSFWQRVGRAGRNKQGLIVYLPLAGNPIDTYYAEKKADLISAKVESAAFNPDYPTILAKHIECGARESGIEVNRISEVFSPVAGNIADTLLKQNKLYLTGIGALRAEGYPHQKVNLRGVSGTQVSVIDSDTGQEIESMNLELAHRELFPGAVYTVQDVDTAHMAVYQSHKLDLVKKEAHLQYLGSESELMTEAESNLDIQPISELENHKVVETTIEGGRLRLRLLWAEITESVSGYLLKKRVWTTTCKNPKCDRFQSEVPGKTCPQCDRALSVSELIKIVDRIVFEEAYQVEYQAPCLTIELNEPVRSALSDRANSCRREILKKYDLDRIPPSLKSLWQAKPEEIAIHSLQHQLVKSIPLVILSSIHDIRETTLAREDKVKGYVFDSTDGGNGAVEAIFHQIEVFAAKAFDLAGSCDCELGCPRCLHSSGCNDANEPLYKELGLFLLEQMRKLH